MTNGETAARIRKWANEPNGNYSWPTYDCSNEQHMKFVEYYRKRMHTYSGTKEKFALEYADMLERGEI